MYKKKNKNKPVRVDISSFIYVFIAKYITCTLQLIEIDTLVSE